MAATYIVKNADADLAGGAWDGTANTVDNYVYLNKIKTTSDPQVVTVYCWGTFDGATVTLRCKPDVNDSNAEWHDLKSFTAKEAPVGLLIDTSAFDVEISSAGASTDVSLLIK